MDQSKWRDPAVRALRTFIQTFIGTLLATGILSGTTLDVNSAKVAVIGAGISATAALLSFVMNLLEDTTGHAALK